jgi:hypothetical protein
MRVLVFSGVALIVAGGILLRKALRMSDPRRYRWFTPRPGTPPGLDPLPDDQSWVRSEDPEAAEAEIARVERDGRGARVLASRYSRVLPLESASPLDLDPAATAEPDEQSAADPDPNVNVESVAPEPPPDQHPEPPRDVQTSFFEGTLRVLLEERGPAPSPPDR